MKQAARILTSSGEILAELNGLPFTIFCQQILQNGFWLTPNHTKWLCPSQIQSIELVSMGTDQQ